MTGDPFFFGYGSLVNRDTHDFPRVARAAVRGWGRTWKRTRLRKVAFLTAFEAPGTRIEGLIAAVPGADWSALDAREYAYDRHPVLEIDHDHERSHDGPATAARPLDIQIYRTRPEHDTDATEAHPILLSYLDTVVQGYLREFGEDGARRFFDTTQGWEAPVFDDRAEPVYPRATPTSGAERNFVDVELRLRDVRRITSL
ncbi:gamma-glutamylcyclotransferase [Roseibacterium sp. SDUM158017]|uniref:gamma-glutamylcyclotransferase family protein n=1 Tax=Roseicyclus salinarum TaxID=3036773 RepID=UPI002414E6DD|nr:gamma-glutamylcyclotransferase family protein [Roseibacterium sp. SDUM158017]MDG4647950.1 gamma-glutamylcyclotransferase [Roseibacterium sp. SDUM158017]